MDLAKTAQMLVRVCSGLFGETRGLHSPHLIQQTRLHSSFTCKLFEKGALPP